MLRSEFLFCGAQEWLSPSGVIRIEVDRFPLGLFSYLMSFSVCFESFWGKPKMLCMIFDIFLVKCGNVM